MAPSRANKKPFTHCVGSSPPWTPDVYASDPEIHKRAIAQLEQHDDLAGAMTTIFSLPRRDTYTYHAIVSVTLAEVQHAISLGGANGLHDWYRSSLPSSSSSEPNQQKKTEQEQEQQQEGKEKDIPLPPPPPADIEAYLKIFHPSTKNPQNALLNLKNNAKKNTLRSSIATHLQQKRFIHPSLTTPKKTAPPLNPYDEVLRWTTRTLEWAGPSPESEKTQTAHHILPILMHHFGCASPTHEALTLLKTLAAGRAVVDIGSGSGYWTWMLRRYGVPCRAVDSQQSRWRTTWVDDTEESDGEAWLRLRENDGGRDMMLLVVYPIVGGGVAGGEEGGFMRGLVRAFRGDTLAVVGTQNRNGYTGFRDITMDEYMARKQPEWTKVVQIPLLSFPGKDDALFVFQREERAPLKVVEPGKGDIQTQAFRS